MTKSMVRGKRVRNTAGIKAYQRAIRKIMKKQGVGRKEAMAIHRHNGQADVIKNDVQQAETRHTLPEIKESIRQRAEFLSATMAGIRQQLEAMQTELGDLVDAAKALGMDDLLEQPGMAELVS